MYYNTIDDTCIIELLMYEKMYNSMLIYNWITDWITDVWELVQRHARHPLITVS